MTATHDTGFEIVELRRYAAHPGRCDALVTLFENEFIETQEACGMVPVGHYRDLGDPNAFVWFRGFPDMESRRTSLEAFYVHSPAWRAHRDAANATIIDSDNVLLLRPARPGTGFDVSGLHRPARRAFRKSGSYAGVAIFMLREAATGATVEQFERTTLRQLEQTARRIAYFVTDEHANDFPRLPIRSGEWAFVVTGICDTDEAFAQWKRTLAESQLAEQLRAQIIGTEHLRLQPAARSLYG